MSKTIVVAVDGSEHGWKALAFAANLAKAENAEMLVLHVVPVEPIPEGFEQWAELEGIPRGDYYSLFHGSKALGDKITSEAVSRSQTLGIGTIRTRVAEGNPTTEIVNTANAEEADVIVLGSRGLGEVQGLLLGSVSHKVMHLAPCTCIAVK